MSTTYITRPGKPPVRLTPTGKAALLGVVALCVAALVAGILAGAFSVVRHFQQPCSVTVEGRTVDLSSGEAEKAASAVARVIHEGGGQPAARKAIRRVVDLSKADAAPVALAFGGRAPGSFSCNHGGGSSESDDLLDSGLTARAEAVRQDLKEVWPGTPLGGFAPGGVSDGHMRGSAHYEGRAIDAFFRPINPTSRRLGWAMAQYYVAHADRLGIATVIFDDQIWTARRAFQGWREYDVDTAGKSAATAAVLEHRDHVHVDVAD